ncbi:MAG: hypothetical protein AAB425_11370, partial [Bdellovibrionota bacterium]
TDQNGQPVKAIALTTGLAHTCALTADHQIKCWGFNHNGQLGLGHRKTVGEKKKDMGNNLVTVDLGKGVKALAITAGAGHT